MLVSMHTNCYIAVAIPSQSVELMVKRIERKEKLMNAMKHLNSYVYGALVCKRNS